MSAVRTLLSLALVLGLAAATSAQAKKAPAAKKDADELTLTAAHGVVDKADKETLVVKPRGADGRFEKTLTLKITGTSKVTVLTPQKRGDKVVLTQRDGSPADLAAGQIVAIIYAVGGDGETLLAAVAQPTAGK